MFVRLDFFKKAFFFKGLENSFPALKTVETFESSYEFSTGAKLAMEGATVSFTPRDCDIMNCPHYYHHCRPSFLKEGEKLRVIDISNEQLTCQHGYQLKLVTADKID